MNKVLSTQPSPSAARAVSIINFLAEHPRQSFKLMDLQRALHLSRTTCHAVLLALIEAGYVHRSSDKSYTLGPALIDIGKAASLGTSALQLAQPEMRRLADTYDVICAATFREGDELVVRDRAISVSHLGFSAPRGIRLPMGFPGSVVQFAWSKPGEFEAWLETLNPPPTPELRHEAQAIIDFVQQHGFAFAFFEEAGDETGKGEPNLGMKWVLDKSGRATYRYTASLEDADYRAAVLMAPVFDARGRVAFILTLTGMSAPLGREEVLACGNDLREACDRVTGAAGGRRPPARAPSDKAQGNN